MQRSKKNDDDNLKNYEDKKCSREVQILQKGIKKNPEGI